MAKGGIFLRNLEQAIKYYKRYPERFSRPKQVEDWSGDDSSFSHDSDATFSGSSEPVMLPPSLVSFSQSQPQSLSQQSQVRAMAAIGFKSQVKDALAARALPVPTTTTSYNTVKFMREFTPRKYLGPKRKKKFPVVAGTLPRPN